MNVILFVATDDNFIFRFHRNAKNEQILNEALNRLVVLCNTHFANIAKELRGLDHYQYARAFSPGLQEYVEAFTYYEYINSGKIIDWYDLQNRMTYDESVEPSVDKENLGEVDEQQIATIEKKSFKCLVQPMEFMLGLGDLSGEVMRRCITSLGTGDVETCFQACTFLQSLYTG